LWSGPFFFNLCALVYGAGVWGKSFYENHATVDRVLEPKKTHTGTLILLHGYDETAEEWIDTAEDIQKVMPWLKIIVPTAASRRIMSTGQPGKLPLEKHAWFDLVDRFGYRGMPEDRHDSTGLRMGRAWLREFIKKETVASKIPSSRVALAGFDMGGALAFFTALTHRKRLAGAAGIGAWIPLQPRITDEYSTKNKEMQVLLQHGEEDIIVPFDHAFKDSDAFLKKQGQPFRKHTYKGVKHDWTGQIEKDLVAYLQQVLPENSDSSSKTSASKKQHEDL